MENSRSYGGSSEMMDTLWLHPSSSYFHENMVNFDLDRVQVRGTIPKREYSGDGFDTSEEEFDMNPNCQSEKKRRLSPNQVQFLEKSFEMENKLEPDRKIELANELGLEPRQVAIWFQNRRARYKTKQLEKVYESLKASYDRLELDYDTLSKENDDLQNEIKTLTKILNQRDVPLANKKLVFEDANSVKSDVVDSESPLCAEDHHSSLMLEEPTDQQSDYSQGEEEENVKLSQRIPPPLLLPPLLPPLQALQLSPKGRG